VLSRVLRYYAALPKLVPIEAIYIIQKVQKELG